MFWSRDVRYKLGGFWRCVIRKRELARLRYQESPELRLNKQLRNMARIRIVN